MKNLYKIIISGKHIYKEVKLSNINSIQKIGTTKNCTIRFHRDLFFEDFELELEYNGNFILTCKESTFLITNGVTKIYTKELTHGDEILVKSEKTKQEIIKISFLLDFDNGYKLYDQIINIDTYEKIVIGGDKKCEIYIQNELVGNDTISIEKKSGVYYLVDNNSKYGVYLNGERIRQSHELKDYDFFSIVSFFFYYKFGKLYVDSRANFIIESLEYTYVKENIEQLQYPKFNRNTRLKLVVDPIEIELLDPPPLPQKPKNNILLSLIPAVGMITLTILLRGIMGGGGYFIIFSVCTISLGIITSILNFISNRRDYKKGLRNRTRKYKLYIKNKRTEINKYRKDELEILNNTYLNLKDEIEIIKNFSGDLFNRQIEDEDFLNTRIGTGATPSKQPIAYKKQEKLEIEDELTNIPNQIAQEYKFIKSAPIVVNLQENCAIGVVGEFNQLYDILKNIIIDICIRHYYNDVKLFFVLNEQNSSLLFWSRLLPHLQNDELNVRNIICDDESKNNILEFLYKELSKRESSKVKTPHYLVFVFNDMGIKKHPISQYIGTSKELGVTFIFFEEHKELLPNGCKKIIYLNQNDSSGHIINCENANNKLSFSYETISDNDAEYIVTRLAPVFCEEISLESSLTKNISLFNLLKIFSVDDLDLNSRWSQSKVSDSIAAPIGVKSKDKVVYLDLHEKAHGPHGLVAGTTGSGKSETIQSYILSMATLYHPYEVSFVIIDFKGGGMVNQFKKLPHLNGAITNIDGREIDRSLKSIKAELKKRQSLFAQSNVNHIDKYISKYKSGEVTCPLPHLIVIVDEFAELKSEQPDFMKELISAARIGRSLGVHLILATQKPSGVVDDQIWSNSKFKLCLKVQNKEDSNEVLKSPLAAEIREPGRAYLQVGNNEIFELFQSAYSGCSVNAENSSNINEFNLNQVVFNGKRKILYSQTKEQSNIDAISQLDAIVDYIYTFCENAEIEKLQDICLPSLPDCIDFYHSDYSKTCNNIRAQIGIYDDPDNQYQGVFDINVTLENTFIIGSSQYGKTNLLQCIIRSLAFQYSPSELNIYILDFGSMVLKNFELLNHVGGVICSSDDEKLKSFFKLINSEVVKRKDKLLSLGVSSFSSYLEAGYKDLPQIVILIDNITALKELYLQEDDELITICREGISLGISIVICNAQTSGIGYKYLSNFACRISLFCNDISEYNNLFDYHRIKPKETPGRCLVKKDNFIYECQTYLAFQGEKEIERVQNMKQFINEQNSKNVNIIAKLIPEIPIVLTNQYINKHYKDYLTNNYSIVIGLNYDTVTPIIFNLCNLGVLALIGKENSGKENFILNILNCLENKSELEPCEVYIIDDINKKLQSYKKYNIVKNYTLDTSLAETFINDFDEVLSKRYNDLINNSEKILNQSPLLILIVQNNDILNVIENNKDLLDKYKNITSKYKAMKFCIIFSNINNETVSYSSPEILKMIKDDRNILIFEDLFNLKFVDIPYTTLKEYKKPIKLGDGYYLKENDIIKLKTVKDD